MCSLKTVSVARFDKTMDATEISKYFECAKALTLEAGKVIEQGLNAIKQIEFKEGDWDVVTKYDKQVENMLIDGLAKKFPEHKFIAEETSSIQNNIPELTNDPTWIIDPIDGTVNFVHSYPQTCISIGFAFQKQLQIGIVYNPSTNELFTAKKGEGSFLNGTPLRTSKITELNKALLAMEPSSLRFSKESKDITLGRLEALTIESQGVRNNGSAALSLAYLARGILDGFHCSGLKSWDVAAGVLIIEEAGGAVCEAKGGPYDLTKSVGLVAAANTQLAMEITKVIIETDLKTQRKRLKRT